MATKFVSNVFAAGYAADPSVAPGVPAPVGSLLPRLGTTDLYQKTGAADTDWTIFSSGGGGNVVTWTVAKTWAQVYAEIVAFGNQPVICLVEYDPGVGWRTMTNNGGADTEISTTQFLGLTPVGYQISSLQSVEIRVDAGFVLGANTSGTATINSKNIDWQFAMPGAISSLGTAAIYLDGGKLSHSGAGYLFTNVDTLVFDLANRANLIGTGGTALIQLLNGATCVGAVRTGAIVNNLAFVMAAGATTADVSADPSAQFGATAWGAGITANLTYLENGPATAVSYDDTLALPTLSATEVQGAIDALKAGVPFGVAQINEIWAPRITAHPADDEFTSGAIGAQWSQTGFTAMNFGTRPNPYSNPVVNAASWENGRDPSNASQTTWLSIQPGAGLAGIWMRLDSALFGGAVPANLLAWARYRFAWRNASGVASGDADCGLSMFAESGAGFSFAQHSTINLNNTQEGAVASVIKPLFWGRSSGGVITNVSEGTRMNNSANNRSDYAFYSGYIGLQKIGTNYHGWLIDDGGNLYMGAHAQGAGTNAVALWFRTASTGNPGVMIMQVDFVRFYEGADWIP